MIKKEPLLCNYVVQKFKFHDIAKNKTLDLIENSYCSNVVNKTVDVDITKTDWDFSTDFNRSWVQFLKDALLDQTLSIYKFLGYGGFRLNEIWFQQYQKYSQHGWHTHSGNFTNVYYLELPADSPKTQLVIPYFGDQIVELDVVEGDIVCFPSFVIHRTTQNLSDKRKTIISYNTDLQYSDDVYGKGLGKNAIF
jgi:hypothetical protein